MTVGLMGRAMTWLVERQRVACPTAFRLLYVRAADEPAIDLTGKAWSGNARMRVSDPATGQLRVVYTDHDYLIPVADLTLSDGTRVEPRRGDRFEETLTEGGPVKVYEVAPVFDEKEWRFVPGELIYRVHVKRVARAGDCGAG